MRFRSYKLKAAPNPKTKYQLCRKAVCCSSWEWPVHPAIVGGSRLVSRRFTVERRGLSRTGVTVRSSNDAAIKPEVPSSVKPGSGQPKFGGPVATEGDKRLSLWWLHLHRDTLIRTAHARVTRRVSFFLSEQAEQHVLQKITARNQQFRGTRGANVECRTSDTVPLRAARS